MLPGLRVNANAMQTEEDGKKVITHNLATCSDGKMSGEKQKKKHEEQMFKTVMKENCFPNEGIKLAKLKISGGETE